MNLFNHAASGLTLAVALTALGGCGGNNVSLVGRDTLPARASQPSQSEIVRTVARIDSASNEIHLRASPSHPGMVTYSAETRVMNLGRTFPVSQLQNGDTIAMQMGMDARGNPHTHTIRVEKSSGDWALRNN